MLSAKDSEHLEEKNKHILSKYIIFKYLQLPRATAGCGASQILTTSAQKKEKIRKILVLQQNDNKNNENKLVFFELNSFRIILF